MIYKCACSTKKISEYIHIKHTWVVLSSSDTNHYTKEKLDASEGLTFC